MAERAHPVTFAEAVRVWARIGVLSFGGPAGQIALMHRELVEKRRWIDDARFLHALNYCMLLPGPEATQLATYVGWLLHGVRGGLVAGALFVLPGALCMLGLSFLYVTARDTPLVAGALLGLKAAVLVVVADALVRIARRALTRGPWVALAVLAFIASALAVPFPLIVLGAACMGALAARISPSLVAPASGPSTPGSVATVVDELAARGMLGHTRGNVGLLAGVLVVGGLVWFAPLLALGAALGPASSIAQEGIFFSKAALVTFGGAYAVLAYVAERAVDTFGWLSAREMLDGLGLAETTPGPLILVLQFVGFMGAYHAPGALPPLVAGALGAAVTTWATFVPCFIWIFAGAPFIERVRAIVGLRGALAGITAAVVGVIACLALWLATHTVFTAQHAWSFRGLSVTVPELGSLDVRVVVLAAAAAVLLWGKKAGLLPSLLFVAASGAVWRLFSL